MAHSRLTAGTRLAPRELTDIAGRRIPLPDGGGLVHLQFRRFAGCPVCDLHLHSFVRRQDELARAGIREVVVFHSSAEDLRVYAADLPFAVIPDPDKRLYAEFGVESSLRALLDPRVWPAIARGVLRSAWGIARGKPVPPLNPRGGSFGLPADFLVAPDGRILAAHYGTHASDQWTVDQVLALARQGGEAVAPATTGLVMNLGWRYDLLVGVLDRVFFRRRLSGLLRKAVELGRPGPGDAVLDVGCGTGTLALLFKRAVGPGGSVAGIDPGPRQIARAGAKARRQGLEIDFRTGTVEALPFADASFDIVVSTLMMHHLPDELKRRGLAEVARVLRPGGKVVVVDFKQRPLHGGRQATLGAGALGIEAQPELLWDAGFSGIQSGDLSLPRFPGLQGAGFAVAIRGSKPELEDTPGRCA